MLTPIDTPAEAALTALAERFEHWHHTRANGCECIPEDLWNQAVALSTRLSNGQVAKRLPLPVPPISENSVLPARADQRRWRLKHLPRSSTSRRQCRGRLPRRARPRSSSRGRMGRGCAFSIGSRPRRWSRWCGRFWRGLDVAADAPKPDLSRRRARRFPHRH
jgi:hypothetical protein